MTNEEQFKALCSQLKAHGQHTNRWWYWHSRALSSRIARVHPETDGHYGLAHNWGNDAAKRALVNGRERWARYAAHRDRLGSEIMAAIRNGEA